MEQQNTIPFITQYTEPSQVLQFGQNQIMQSLATVNANVINTSKCVTHQLQTMEKRVKNIPSRCCGKRKRLNTAKLMSVEVSTNSTEISTAIKFLRVMNPQMPAKNMMEETTRQYSMGIICSIVIITNGSCFYVRCVITGNLLRCEPCPSRSRT